VAAFMNRGVARTQASAGLGIFCTLNLQVAKYCKKIIKIKK